MSSNNEMTLKEELNLIKKAYGETFMHFCRGAFTTVLEHRGLLYSILTSSFSTNCQTLYSDLIIDDDSRKRFILFVLSKAFPKKEEEEIKTDKTPYEIFDELGYDLYECTTEEEIQSFKKYYAKGEELCTFKEGNRLESNFVFFAVRRDADSVKRAEKPSREDAYSKSVMSIQFTRWSPSQVSIKSRYNHTVENPDAVEENKLDRVLTGAEGLRYSFKQLLLKRGIELRNPSEQVYGFRGYIQAEDGKFYKFNHRIGRSIFMPG